MNRPMRFTAPLLILLAVSEFVFAELPFADRFEPRMVLVDFDTDVVTWGPTTSEAELQQRGAASVSDGTRSIYIGTQQATSINQNPIVASFTNGVLDWVVNGYETGGPDGRAVGILWDQHKRLYVAMTVDGGGSGLEAFATSGWQSSYGSGGGPRVTVLLRLSLADGQPLSGTFSIARLSSGNTNTVLPTDLMLVNNQIVLFANSFFAPLDVDLMRMTQTDTGGSPFPYRVVFDTELETALSAEAIGWDGVTEFSPLP